MKNFRILSFHPNEKGDPRTEAKGIQDPFSRRREQVRRAQKAYRERKEVYIKSLESEVVQLRSHEARALRENNRLQTELTKLKNFLNHYGIQPPDSSDDGSQASISSPSSSGSPASTVSTAMTSISIGSSSHGGRQLHVESPQLGSQSPPTKNHSAALANVGPPVAVMPRKQFTSDIDPTVLGMEFVLALEAPCLDHIHGDPQKPNAPTGHILTATAPLLQLSPPSISDGSPQPWQAPKETLERLLDLSHHVFYEDEVSPIQAWNYIKQHPQFRDMELERIKFLEDKLLKHIKCHGFGAVVRRDDFENMVFEAFVVGRVFQTEYFI